MIRDGMKWCPKHEGWVVLEGFNRRTASKDGLAHACKDCERTYHKEHYKKRATKLVHKRSKLKLNYGLTIEQFNQMFDEQKGCCALCGEKGHKLVVDHNHRTGDVRRLLCQGCNHGIGRFKDDPDLCRRAARYLEIYGH